MFATVAAEQVSGKIVWCNFALARELGFDVPPSNLMTSEFHAHLIDALSYRAVQPKEATGDGKIIRLYADRYGGAGVAPALGSARSGFLPYGNLFLKGIGFTPLFKHDNADDFAHSTGLMPLGEGLFEAVFGEVNDNLFTHGTTRILALIDQDKHLVYPDGRKRLCAIAVRAGTQLRPGHLLAVRIRRKNFRLHLFLAITRASGQLVMRRGSTAMALTPDIKATMLRVLDDHARSSAELFRWRMLHGALSPSNMEMSAAMLDLATQTSQPRTAPIRVLTWDGSIFGREHLERAIQLWVMYRALLRSITTPQRRRLNAVAIDLTDEIGRRYERHLPLVLLRAVGLKEEVAAHINAAAPALARRFTATFNAMARLRNPGSMLASRSRPLSESASVLDVFNLLRVFPKKYFANPAGRHYRSIRAALKPVFKGNQFQRAKKRTAVQAFIREFESIYRELISVAETVAEKYYAGRRNMQASIVARAAFENRPFAALYFSKLFREFRAAEVAYTATGDVATVSAAIDERVTASLRNVDALLAQGTTRRMPAGVFEVERRTIAGVDYAVRAWDNRQQKRRMRVCVPVEHAGGRYAIPLFGLSGLGKRQVQSFRCRFTTDGWQHSEENVARLELVESRKLVLSLEIKCEPYTVGELAVIFDNADGRAAHPTAEYNFRGYTFAIPDRQELHKLTKSQRRRQH
jgi:hypothetical protein